MRAFEPCHEIMALFILHNIILQTRMLSHPVGLEVCFLVRPFVCFHISCVQKRRHRCAGLPKPSLVTYERSTITSWADSYVLRWMVFDQVYAWVLLKELFDQNTSVSYLHLWMATVQFCCASFMASSIQLFILAIRLISYKPLKLWCSYLGCRFIPYWQYCLWTLPHITHRELFFQIHQNSRETDKVGIGWYYRIIFFSSP